VLGTHIAETILASVHVRAHHQAGHMDASDRINQSPKALAGRRPSTYGQLKGWPMAYREAASTRFFSSDLG
jgi:hypothetical protein